MSNKSDQASEQKRIAVFAIENDTLYASVATGAVVSVTGEGGIGNRFRYQHLKAPRSVRMGRTLSPEELTAKLGDFLRTFGIPDYNAIGLSTYGAVDREAGAFISTPSDDDHPNPSVLNFRNVFEKLVGGATPVIIENDTTAAAVGEYIWGVGRRIAAPPKSAFVYVWVGRGVNAAILIDGSPLAVRFRPEIAHLTVHSPMGQSLVDPITRGSCSDHERCVTGMAGLRTALARLSHPSLSQPNAIAITADYVAQLCAVMSLTIAPHRIAIGGSQMSLPWGDALYEAIRDRYPEHINGAPAYIDPSEMIVRAELDMRASLLGVTEIARQAIMPQYTLDNE